MLLSFGMCLLFLGDQGTQGPAGTDGKIGCHHYHTHRDISTPS